MIKVNFKLHKNHFYAREWFLNLLSSRKRFVINSLKRYFATGEVYAF
jgi:hypothetical protein